MQRFLFYTMLLSSAGVYSCNSNPEAASTPIDSTNVNGTAPVEYGKDDTAPMLPDANQGEGYRANTPGGDSIPAPNK
ncbi:hypothetical protein F0919_16040 [Taibaiella lutea]|uniref:Uncharacterized protein n=1 Tax=Taibaiella lutea TaxID=2608001 RepID=A0A5M6CAZ9_9BACT|nr:hypothetical protein [Taibaiella lutea]KAA5532304.1 hypothetical protein F0919_16040 [Taibaiella lutea]